MNSYGPFSIAATQIPTQIGTQNNALDSGADRIVFYNLSPYTLIIDAKDGRNFNKKIMPMDRDVIQTGPQYSGIILYTAVSDLAVIAGQSPASILYLETYGPHEAIQGTYPASLNYLTTVGNQVLIASELVNKSGTSLAPIIDANEKPLSGQTFVVTMNNDGSAQFGEGLPLVAQVSWDNAGNLTATQSVTTAALNASAPVKLKSGFQETGKCGQSYTNVAAGQTMGPTTNFKTVMTNVPTSITLNTPSENVNANAPAVGDIDIYGFWLEWSAPAAGTSRYVNTYTTVGN